MNTNELIEMGRAERLRRGLSQSAVAEAMGAEQARISKMERGRHRPTADGLLDYLKAVGLEVSCKPKG